MKSIPTTAAPITLRPFTEADIPLLYTWFRKPHIIEWWGEDDANLTLSETVDEYALSKFAEYKTSPYIAMLNAQPIGFAQSYIAFGASGGWWESETDPGVRGIDQFLAEESLLGKGVGTSLVNALTSLLFEDQDVTKIQTDPSPRNLRAIRCYEKAGFHKIRSITTPDGQAIYMLKERLTVTAAAGAA